MCRPQCNLSYVRPDPVAGNHAIPRNHSIELNRAGASIVFDSNAKTQRMCIIGSYFCAFASFAPLRQMGVTLHSQAMPIWVVVKQRRPIIPHHSNSP
jgi:hypothetical protein